jgi:hypothetical protein
MNRKYWENKFLNNWEREIDFPEKNYFRTYLLVLAKGIYLGCESFFFFKDLRPIIQIVIKYYFINFLIFCFILFKKNFYIFYY